MPSGPAYRLGQLLLLLLFLLALAGGVALLVRQGSPKGVEVLLPTPTPGPDLRVYLSGAVNSPGVYAVQAGNRLEEVLALAGGPTEVADLNRVNLAQRVRDQDHFHIPALGEATPAPSNTAQSGSGTTPGERTAGKLNLNTATLEELVALPGIGEVRAKAILAYRQQRGPFKSLDELLQVQGIGQSILERLRPLLTIE